MNILEGIKATNPKPNTANSTKFIIKSKPSVKENRPTDHQSDTNYASNQDIHQLITYIINKSKRLSDLLQAKNIDDAADFHERNLYNNPCIRTFLKSIMDKMLADRRLGKALKGINKGILTEIENNIWTSIEREVTLYQLDRMYEKEKTSLQKQLRERREEIAKQMELLSTDELQKNLVLQPETQN